MADDLRHWSVVRGPSSAVKDTTAPDAPLGTTDHGPRTTDSDDRLMRIVPKGLRSFDAHDADFFLELLPGPRDRDGLPDSIRFWKTRIEERDPDSTFAVGLIYGPSGCGKSSLVKAGLLPRLSDDVIAIYVEATAEETEARLLHGLRKRCPGLPASLGLADTLAALRVGQAALLVPVPKVLLVLDQFEQWLHAKPLTPTPLPRGERGRGEGELVQALRQCDGGRVQCVVMVRDDFWLATSRFMRALEVPLLEGQNSALVDLFDPDHARKVLAAFGRAFGKLPEDAGATSSDQREFLSRSVQGLAQEGKVISVRLALFAEMMKGKPWTPAALKAVGGTEGIGATFLEETFSAATAPPEHRYHQKAARAVLKALLPESGTDIKGHMRAHAELLAASGYAGRLKEFADLLHILDSEVRLITPTDPEGVAGDEWRVAGRDAGENTYDRTALPTVGSVAVRHGPGGEVLSGDQGLPERGAIWPDKSDPTVGGVDPGKYSRGTGKGAHEGIPQPLEHRPRIAHGGGNAPDVEPAGGVAPRRGAGAPIEVNRPHQSDAHGPAQSAGKTPELLTAPATRHPPPTTRYYQLTHDYLVPSFRDWLTRKQKETRRGRAELLLADRAAVWTARPENRQLPSLWQWASIRIWTRTRDWTPPQRTMMGKAGRYHLTRALLAALLLAAGAWTGVAIWGRVEEDRNRTHAAGLVKGLVNADMGQVPALLNEIDGYRTWAEPLLREEYDSAPAESPQKLHAALALLRTDTAYRDYVYQRLLNAAPQEIKVVRDELNGHADALRDGLWQVVDHPPPHTPHQRLRAACALAAYDPSANAKWHAAATPVAEDMLAAALKNPSHYPVYLELLQPVGVALVEPLAAVFRNPGRSEAERLLATNLLAEFAAPDPARLADLLMDADEKQFAVLYPKLQVHGPRALAPLKGELGKRVVAHTATILKIEGTLTDKEPPVKVVAQGKVLSLPAKAFPLKLQAGKMVTLTMASTDFDAFLVLHDSAGKQLAFDDDGGGNQNARLVWVATKDETCTVYAASFKGAGAFVVKGVATDVNEAVKESLAKRQANAAVALLRMGEADPVWPLLKHSRDPRGRSYLVHRFAPLGVNAQPIVDRIEVETDLTIRRALVLSLGEFDDAALAAYKDALTPKLQAMFQDHPDPGLRSAAEWLLRKWHRLERRPRTRERAGRGSRRAAGAHRRGLGEKCERAALVRQRAGADHGRDSRPRVVRHGLAGHRGRAVSRAGRPRRDAAQATHRPVLRDRRQGSDGCGVSQIPPGPLS